MLDLKHNRMRQGTLSEAMSAERRSAALDMPGLPSSRGRRRLGRGKGGRGVSLEHAALHVDTMVQTGLLKRCLNLDVDGNSRLEVMVSA